MKALLLAALVLLAAPATASAAVTIVARDVPLGGARTLAASAAPPRFDLVGLHWQGTGRVSFRTRGPGGRWSSWRPAAPEAEDLPDADTAEATPAGAWRLGNPYWTGPSDRIAYRLRGRVGRLRAYFVWSPVDGLPPRRLSIAGSPAIIPRVSWGANEAIRRAAPQYADGVHFALVHHTAGTNGYSPSQSAAIVRGIEVYHVQGNGWNDIGYNFLVDKYGQVFEGRYGGVEKSVVGAHAEGFNTGSVGVAVIGNYADAPISAAARSALVNLLSWRLDLAHVDPLSSLTWASGGNPRYPGGTPVFLRAVSGHRDTGFTTCPGDALYAQLGSIAGQVAAAGLPKLYAPFARGEIGGPVRFRARLTTALPWTVTVTDAARSVVATGSGTGTDVDWTWDSTSAPKARYTYAIAAGEAVRPATGSVGSKPVPLALKSPTARPGSIVSDGTKSTISYVLTTPATVTAVLRGPDGTQLATLFSERKAAGKQSFVFTAQRVADGNYQIALSATDGTTTVTTSVPVLVDRAVRDFAAVPTVFSPNGDGRLDEIAFRLRLARAATQVRLEVQRGGKSVATIFSGSLGVESQSIGWDGSSGDSRVADGGYSAVLTVTDGLGTVVRAAPFQVDTTAPRIRTISFRRLRFRISEPARVTIAADGRLRVRRVGAGVFSFPVSRAPRRVVVSAQDAAGNVSRVLRLP